MDWSILSWFVPQKGVFPCIVQWRWKAGPPSSRLPPLHHRPPSHSPHHLRWHSVPNLTCQSWPARRLCTQSEQRTNRREEREIQRWAAVASLAWFSFNACVAFKNTPCDLCWQLMTELLPFSMCVLKSERLWGLYPSHKFNPSVMHHRNSQPAIRWDGEMISVGTRI